MAPQATRTLDLGIGRMPAGRVVTLTVRYQLKEADPLLPAGHEVAYDQFVLRDEPALPVGTPEPVKGVVKTAETASAYTFSGTVAREGTLSNRFASWEVTIDKKLGALTSYKLDGKEMVSAPMVPCFDRALIENDLGARFQNRFAMWRGVDFKVASVEASTVGNDCQVDVTFAPIDGKAVVKGKPS